jgi:hypothetical protein
LSDTETAALVSQLLDAIHLIAVQRRSDRCERWYDARTADAAAVLGVPIVSPA